MKNAPPGKLERRREAACARFEATLALKELARMWTTPILLVLMEGPRRHSELHRALEPISAKVLTQRLKELGAQDLVSRVEVVREPPKTVVYRLTARGEAARPMLEALMEWRRTASAGMGGRSG